MYERHKPMYYNTKNVTIGIAKILRKKMTDSENLLWERLKRKQIKNLKFRRQHPIGFLIADFYCHEIKLVIEVDGEIHKQKVEWDDGRTAEFERMGISILRFTNDEISKSIDEVIDEITLFVINHEK